MAKKKERTSAKSLSVLKPAEVRSLAATNSLGDVVDGNLFAMVAEPQSLRAVMYNLRDEKISEFDLDRVKIASGGGTVFQVPSLEGIENQEELVGVILTVGRRRAFWEKSGVSSDPPLCYSTDGITGIAQASADPQLGIGGECSGCPMNEFGSAISDDGSQGKGKRCKERRLMLFLRFSDRLPIAISAPPASLKAVKQFMLRLPVPMFQAVVSITLVPDKNADGVPFSKLDLSYVGHLSEEQGKALERYAAVLKSSIIAQAPSAGEVVEAAPPVEEFPEDEAGGAEDLPD